MFECVQINMNSEEPHVQMPGPCLLYTSPFSAFILGVVYTFKEFILWRLFCYCGLAIGYCGL